MDDIVTEELSSAETVVPQPDFEYDNREFVPTPSPTPITQGEYLEETVTANKIAGRFGEDTTTTENERLEEIVTREDIQSMSLVIPESPENKFSIQESSPRSVSPVIYSEALGIGHDNHGFEESTGYRRRASRRESVGEIVDIAEELAARDQSEVQTLEEHVEVKHVPVREMSPVSVDFLPPQRPIDLSPVEAEEVFDQETAESDETAEGPDAITVTFQPESFHTFSELTATSVSDELAEPSVLQHLDEAYTFVREVPAEETEQSSSFSQLHQLSEESAGNVSSGVSVPVHQERVLEEPVAAWRSVEVTDLDSPDEGTKVADLSRARDLPWEPFRDAQLDTHHVESTQQDVPKDHKLFSGAVVRERTQDDREPQSPDVELEVSGYHAEETSTTDSLAPEESTGETSPRDLAGSLSPREWEHSVQEDLPETPATVNVSDSHLVRPYQPSDVAEMEYHIMRDSPDTEPIDRLRDRHFTFGEVPETREDAVIVRTRGSVEVRHDRFTGDFIPTENTIEDTPLVSSNGEQTQSTHVARETVIYPEGEYLEEHVTKEKTHHVSSPDSTEELVDQAAQSVQYSEGEYLEEKVMNEKVPTVVMPVFVDDSERESSVDLSVSTTNEALHETVTAVREDDIQLERSSKFAGDQPSDGDVHEREASASFQLVEETPEHELARNVLEFVGVDLPPTEMETLTKTAAYGEFTLPGSSSIFPPIGGMSRRASVGEAEMRAPTMREISEIQANLGSSDSKLSETRVVTKTFARTTTVSSPEHHVEYESPQHELARATLAYAGVYLPKNELEELTTAVISPPENVTEVLVDMNIPDVGDGMEAEHRTQSPQDDGDDSDTTFVRQGSESDIKRDYYETATVRQGVTESSNQSQVAHERTLVNEEAQERGDHGAAEDEQGRDEPENRGSYVGNAEIVESYDSSLMLADENTPAWMQSGMTFTSSPFTGELNRRASVGEPATRSVTTDEIQEITANLLTSVQEYNDAAQTDYMEVQRLHQHVHSIDLVRSVLSITGVDITPEEMEEIVEFAAAEVDDLTEQALLEMPFDDENVADLAIPLVNGKTATFDNLEEEEDTGMMTAEISATAETRTGTRTIVRTSRTTISRSPLSSPGSEIAESLTSASSFTGPIVSEVVTIRSTRSSVASSPGDYQPARPSELQFPEETVGGSPDARSPQDDGALRTVIRREVRTLTSTTHEGSVDDESGEQIITRVTRQTVVRTTAGSGTELTQDISDDAEIASMLSASPVIPLLADDHEPARSPFGLTLPSLTTYTSIGPEVISDDGEKTITTKVTTTRVVSHPPSPLPSGFADEKLVIKEERSPSGGRSPSQQQFAEFVSHALGDVAVQALASEQSAGDQSEPGELEITRTESQGAETLIRKETQKYTFYDENDGEGDRTVVTTVTTTTVVTNKSDEDNRLAESLPLEHATQELVQEVERGDPFRFEGLEHENEEKPGSSPPTPSEEDTPKSADTATFVSSSDSSNFENLNYERESREHSTETESSTDPAEFSASQRQSSYVHFPQPQDFEKVSTPTTSREKEIAYLSSTESIAEQIATEVIDDAIREVSSSSDTYVEETETTVRDIGEQLQGTTSPADTVTSESSQEFRTPVGTDSLATSREVSPYQSPAESEGERSPVGQLSRETSSATTESSEEQFFESDEVSREKLATASSVDSEVFASQRRMEIHEATEEGTSTAETDREFGLVGDAKQLYDHGGRPLDRADLYQVRVRAPLEIRHEQFSGDYFPGRAAITRLQPGGIPVAFEGEYLEEHVIKTNVNDFTPSASVEGTAFVGGDQHDVQPQETVYLEEHVIEKSIPKVSSPVRSEEFHVTDHSAAWPENVTHEKQSTNESITRVFSPLLAEELSELQRVVSPELRSPAGQVDLHQMMSRREAHEEVTAEKHVLPEYQIGLSGSRASLNTFVRDRPDVSARESDDEQDDDHELLELESREILRDDPNAHVSRQSARSYVGDANRPRTLLPTTSVSLPEISKAALSPSTDVPRSVSERSEISEISISSGRITSESSRPESPGSPESDTTLQIGSPSPGILERTPSSTASSFEAPQGSVATSPGDSYHTAAEEIKRSSSEYDTCQTDFSGSGAYHTATESVGSPGSRQLGGFASPQYLSDREGGVHEEEHPLVTAAVDSTQTYTAEISELARTVVAEFGTPEKSSPSRRQESWELIGPEDINSLRKTENVEYNASDEEFDYINVEELQDNLREEITTGVVSEPETEKSFTLGDEIDMDTDITELPTETLSEPQNEPKIEYPVVVSPIEPSYLFAETNETSTVVRSTEEVGAGLTDSGLAISGTNTASTISDTNFHDVHHEISDTFDENRRPYHRERTPDPTPELPEERSWTRSDFAPRPTFGMGSRQYSESEFSEAELRDLARRGSEVSMQDIFRRPESPEPPESSPPSITPSGKADEGENVSISISPDEGDLDDTVTTDSVPADVYLQPLEDIQEEKESSSGESERFPRSAEARGQTERDSASSASGSLHEFERLEAETRRHAHSSSESLESGNGQYGRKPAHDTESLNSLTEFERLEETVVHEEKDRSPRDHLDTSFYSPEAESMTHSETMSSDTASTVVERAPEIPDDDVQSQHTDRDVMSESLDEGDLRDRLGDRGNITTDSLEEAHLRALLSPARRIHEEQGIMEVGMDDSLDSDRLRRIMEPANIMADSLTHEELLRQLRGEPVDSLETSMEQEALTASTQITIPPAELPAEAGTDKFTVRRFLVTGHPTLQTISFSGGDAEILMQEFLNKNQGVYPDLQIYEAMEEHVNKENEPVHSTTTTRIVKRRHSSLKDSVETVTFTGLDSDHEMAKFLSHTMPLDYDETETIECETRDESGGITRLMTRRLSRVDVAAAHAASARAGGVLGQISISSIGDILERSPTVEHGDFMQQTPTSVFSSSQGS